MARDTIGSEPLQPTIPGAVMPLSRKHRDGPRNSSSVMKVPPKERLPLVRIPFCLLANDVGMRPFAVDLERHEVLATRADRERTRPSIRAVDRQPFRAFPMPLAVNLEPVVSLRFVGASHGFLPSASLEGKSK